MQSELRRQDAADDGGAEAADGAPLRMLVIGGGEADRHHFDAIDGLRCVAEPGRGFNCVALIEPISDKQLRTAGDTVLRLLAPIAAFGFFEDLRTDFAAPSLTPVTLRQAVGVLRPICERLADIPDIDGKPDQDGLLALGLAVTRQKPIEAAWHPDGRDAVWYPLLGAMPGARRQLETFADLGLVQRRFFKRANNCGRCASSRLNVYECCVQCGGAQLGEEEIVHHYACGQEAAQSAFIQDQELVCPKCRKKLRHFGVDYDKPGTVITCRDCDKIMADPRVAFDCLDCGHTTPGDGIETLDWHHYDVVADGIAALHEGHLPQIDFNAILPARLRTYSERDFRMLAAEAARVAERYGRPFSMMAVSVINREELGEEHGAARTGAAFRLMVDLLAESVREADIVTVTRDQTIMVTLPETAEAGAMVIANRFRDSVAESVDLPIRLDISVDAESGAADMLEALK